MNIKNLGFDLDVLNTYVEQGYVNKVKHPVHDIYIYKYTFKTAMEKKWDVVTINTRSLVLDAHGNILSLPFEKFFNNRQEMGNDVKIYNEMGHSVFVPNYTKISVYNYNPEPYIISEKKDGSFIQVFMYKGEIIFTSSSVFDSEHAQIAEQLFMEKLDENLRESLHPILQNNTVMFELIHPDYRIVVDYRDIYDEPIKDLYLIGIRNKNNGKYFTPQDMITVANKMNWRHIHFYAGTTWQDIVQQQKTAEYENIEGYVVYFPEQNFRVKVKLNSYFEAHKLVNNLTDKNILINFCINGGEELYDILPDEFYSYVKDKVSQFTTTHNHLTEMVNTFYEDNKHLDRKEYAILAAETDKVLMSLFMNKYLDRPLNVWEFMLKRMGN